MNILCIANSNYLNCLYIFLLSLFSNNLSNINVYLIHSDISNNDLESISNFFSKWEHKSFHPIHYDLSFAEEMNFSDSFPKEVYFRLLCADILPSNVDKILSLDLDMVVNKSLENLYDTDISSYPLAACKDIYGYIFGEAQKNLTRLNLNPSLTYFNAGTMLINLSYLRKNLYSKKLIDYTNQMAEKLYYCEQDVLNFFFIESYLELPWHEYNLTPIMYILKNEDVQNGIISPLYQQDIHSITSFDGFADYSAALRDNASIIHYIGESKPWLSTRPSSQTYNTFDIYYHNYRKMLEELI